MENNYRKYLLWGIQLLAILVIVVGFKNPVSAAITLPVNDDGDYCINSAEDFYQFIEDVRTDERFEGKRIILTQDIKIVGEEKVGTYSFRGTFDGLGHEIDFTANNLDETVVVFPFNIRNASICNLRINTHEKLYASKSTSNNFFEHHVLSNAFRDSSLKRVQIYGDITLVYDKAGQSVSLSAIPNGRNSIIEDVSVDLNYDYDKDSSLSNAEIKESLKDSWYISFNALGSMCNAGVTGMSIKNFYSSSSYSANITELAGIIKENMDPSQFSGLIVKAICAETNSATTENVMFDKEKYPEVTDAVTDNLKYNVEGFTLENNDSFGKSTADMKLQSTYTGFDFDNTWGMSEYINDGYPYLKAFVSPELIALIDQIVSLPAPDKLTVDDKALVEQIKTALEGLSDKDKAMIALDTLNDVMAKAEEAIKAKEEEQKPEDNTEKQDPAEKTTAKKKATTVSVKKGAKFKVKGYTYKVTSNKKKNPTVTVLGYKNKKLKKIVVPATVKYKKISFKVTAINKNAFKKQKKAKTATIGNNVASIGTAAFAGDVSLAKVTIGKKVKTIGGKAFYGDKKLKKIVVKSTVLKKVGSKAFYGIYKKAVIKVPKKKLKAYKKLMKGKGQAKTVKIKK